MEGSDETQALVGVDSCCCFLPPALAKANKGTDYVAIPATDGKVASVADAVKENLEYRMKGPNSNAAAQAVADRAAGNEVGTPTEYDPAVGAGKSRRIEFDDEKIRRDEAAGVHREQVKTEPPPS
jgi:hypothetical protein